MFLDDGRRGSRRQGWNESMHYQRPWDLGARDRSRDLRVQLSLAGKELSVEIPPWLLVLTILCGVCCFKVATMQAYATQERQAARILELKRQKDQLEATLAHKEIERERMASLAQARSEELWRELESREREVSRLWRIVGSAPSHSQLTSSALPARRSLMGSRGSSRRSALAVKVNYNHLTSKIEQGALELEELYAAVEEYQQKRVDKYRRELASRTPSIAPCSGDMTSGFGNRLHPVYGIGRFHAGCDFTAPHGTPIRATAAGTVVHSDWLGGYGQVVEIDHGEELKTLYAHCSELLVRKGDEVKKGQVIAKVGTTGLSSGPHCHYEVHRGKQPIDPMPYLKSVPVRKDAPKKMANSQE